MQKVQLAATQIIYQVLVQGRNLNQLLDENLKTKSNWKPAERGAIRDLSYGTLRYYGQLRAILRLLLNKPIEDKRVENLLLITLYQLLYSRATQHTVVNQAVECAGVLQPRLGGLVNAVLRNFIRRQAELVEYVQADQEAKYNYPSWWIKELSRQYHEQANAILAVGNGHPPMTLRVNRHWGTVDAYLTLLVEHDMAATIITTDAIKLEKPVNVDRLPGFSAGWVSVQDAGAQHASRLLDVKDGMRVLDACAAPGGKTTHILELANVDLSALDIDANRLDRVRENLHRLDMQANLSVGNAAKPNAWWNGNKFDRILADVPCSASGVVRRHPDIKWLRRLEDIAGFAVQQKEIIQSLWPLLNSGGKLLYATCSLFKQENEMVIANFLDTHNDACRIEISIPNCVNGQLLPNAQHDGFFYALLQKSA